MLPKHLIKCSSDLSVLYQPIMPLSPPLWVACGLKWVWTKVSFSSFKDHRQASQSIWESLGGANKLMGFNSKHVFPLHASPCVCTHPEDVVFRDTHTAATLSGSINCNIRNHLVISATFNSKVWRSKACCMAGVALELLNWAWSNNWGLCWVADWAGQKLFTWKSSLNPHMSRRSLTIHWERKKEKKTDNTLVSKSVYNYHRNRDKCIETRGINSFHLTRKIARTRS